MKNEGFGVCRKESTGRMWAFSKLSHAGDDVAVRSFGGKKAATTATAPRPVKAPRPMVFVQASAILS